MLFKPKFKPPQYWEDADKLVQEGRFLEPFESFWGFNSPEFRIISKSDNLGWKIHVNDARFNGEPYIYHPERAALMVGFRLGIWGPYVTVGIILHDVVEDHGNVITPEAIEVDFNDLSSVIVVGLTKQEKIGLEDYPEVRSRAKALKVKAAGSYAVIAKGYENNDNIATLPDDNFDFQRRQLEESEKYILPITRQEPRLYADLSQMISKRKAYLEKYS
jgi:(p)ppGpp synthase/HD superfamily hydrolase